MPKTNSTHERVACNTLVMFAWMRKAVCRCPPLGVTPTLRFFEATSIRSFWAAFEYRIVPCRTFRVRSSGLLMPPHQTVRNTRLTSSSETSRREACNLELVAFPCPASVQNQYTWRPQKQHHIHTPSRHGRGHCITWLKARKARKTRMTFFATSERELCVKSGVDLVVYVELHNEPYKCCLLRLKNPVPQKVDVNIFNNENSRQSLRNPQHDHHPLRCAVFFLHSLARCSTTFIRTRLGYISFPHAPFCGDLPFPLPSIFPCISLAQLM